VQGSHIKCRNLYTIFTVGRGGGLEGHEAEDTLEAVKSGLLNQGCRLTIPDGDGSLEEGIFVDGGMGPKVLVFHVMVRSCAGVCWDGEILLGYCYKIVAGFESER